MRLSYSITEAAERIVASPSPVLLLDTCAVVDVIRAPSRGKNFVIQPAIELAEKVTSTPAGLHAVIAPVIPPEWMKHGVSEKEKLDAVIAKHDQFAGCLENSCELSGLSPMVAIPKYGERGLSDRLYQIASDLICGAILLDESEQCQLKAVGRSVRRVPPAREGKIHDCVIVEHYLALCSKLRAERFHKAIVFATSNTNDFCESGKKTLHPNLKDEFDSLNMVWVSDLAEAKAKLGL